MTIVYKLCVTCNKLNVYTATILDIDVKDNSLLYHCVLSKLKSIYLVCHCH